MKRPQIIGLAAALCLSVTITAAAIPHGPHPAISQGPIQRATGPQYPNPNLTPGVADPSITEAVVTSPNFTTRNFRDVPDSEKKADAKEYGVDWSQHSLYEFDHFISIEIGGSNDIKNLWPEPLHLNVNGFDEGAKTKDRIEDVLGRLVHVGTISLVEAQQEITTDWVAAYKQRIGPLPRFGS